MRAGRALTAATMPESAGVAMGAIIVRDGLCSVLLQTFIFRFGGLPERTPFYIQKPFALKSSEKGLTYISRPTLPKSRAPRKSEIAPRRVRGGALNV